MQHKIEFVDDDALPEGHDFMLVTAEGAALIFYRRSAVTPANLEDSWAAYRALQQRQQTPPPSAMNGRDGPRLVVLDSRRLA